MISSNQISGYFKGIYITADNADTYNIIVESNKVTDCGYHSIAAHKSIREDIRLENMQFKNNFIARCEQGPVFRAVKKSSMSGNEVVDNIIGIRIERSDNNDIVGNKVHHNMKNGIFLYGRSIKSSQ
jgi:parallel beta-helix repeat protein